MSFEDNGNVGFMKPTLSSTEDLSEYTDADESMSAPTELLAEFLSAVMMKEYENALKCCKLILHYEPNNATAKEFYPLILKKIKQSAENESEDSCSDSEENSSSSSNESSSSSNGQDDEDDEIVEEIEVNVDNKKGSSNGDNTTGSYSSLEEDDEGGVIEQLASLSASSKYKQVVDNADFGNGNKVLNNYETQGVDGGVGEKNGIMNIKDYKCMSSVVGKNETIYSDSESPTEPIIGLVSQETISNLRSRVVPN